MSYLFSIIVSQIEEKNNLYICCLPLATKCKEATYVLSFDFINMQCYNIKLTDITDDTYMSIKTIFDIYIGGDNEFRAIIRSSNYKTNRRS